MQPNTAQSSFARALLARAGVPADLRLAGDSETVARRFGVHRNNLFASLVTSLAARFPVVQLLAGEAFFRGMAAAFVAEAPPPTPVLLEYGGGFPAFIAQFGPAKDVPYLADVARFEWARHDALNAADAEPADLSIIAAAAPETLADLRLILHPAARVFASNYPVVTVWRIHMDGAEATGELSGPEAVLITRPDLSVHVHSLTPGSLAFLTVTLRGGRLGEAAAAAQTAQADFDLAAALTQIFMAGAIAGLSQSSQDT